MSPFWISVFNIGTAAVAAYAVAIVILAILKSCRIPVLAVWVMTSLLLLCPLLIPADQVIARALSFFPCIGLWFKLIDLGRILRSRQPLTAHQAVWVLVPFPIVVSGPIVWKPPQIVPIDVVRIIAGVVTLPLGFALLAALTQVDALRSSFLLDHLVKLVLFVVTIEILSQSLWGLEHIAGFQTELVIRYAFVSQTVGEFWRRYDTRVFTWLHNNVFVPSGGARKPLRALFLTFFISAVLHEVAFGIATSRFDGYQFSFFMLQAPAAVISSRLDGLFKQTGMWRGVLNRMVTIPWFAVTSMLFFHGVARIFPTFYASRPWLP